MRILLFIIVLLGTFQLGYSQSAYWILFKDKGSTQHISPYEILSQQALLNRARQGIEVDFYDYPISQTYRSQLNDLGISEKRKSKWLNGVSAYLTVDQIRLVNTLPFVREVRPVSTFSRIAEVEMSCDTIEDVNEYTRQLSMLELDRLHAFNYTGQGVTIAVFDNGFRAVDTLEAFQHIFENNRLIAAKDFVDNDDNVYENCDRSSFCKHGTNVLSVLAAKSVNQLTGSAPDANYILLRTENDASETHQEEDNWIAAAEFADSLGAQVFSTSLGYRRFDAGEGSYTFEDMDGETALITIAADIAASRGITVVNSAGNDGGLGISAPADGKSVISVGAVDRCESYSPFSSQGPTADGRMKPDITAMGQATFVLETDGITRNANGTSFSCPLIAGFMACLIQASPESSREQLYDALIQSADRYSNPDNFFGYGIPSGSKAFEILSGQTLTNIAPELLSAHHAILYPNPNNGSFKLSINGSIRTFRARIEVVDAMGRRIAMKENVIEPPARHMSFQQNFARGLYHVLVHDLDRKELFFSGKILVE